jgi:hypothetical protein
MNKFGTFVLACIFGLIGFGMLTDGSAWGLLFIVFAIGGIAEAFKRPKYKYKGSTHHFEKEK